MVLGLDPYDPARWRDATIVFGTQTPDTPVYAYFPWVAVALVPLALVPLEAAAWIWMVATVALAAVAFRSLLIAQPGFSLSSQRSGPFGGSR